jgi:hypothetical protein
MGKKLTRARPSPRLGSNVHSKLGDISEKTKSSTGAILRRRRSAVAPFRRDRRDDRGSDDTRAIPDWGRIVLRSATTTLR